MIDRALELGINFIDMYTSDPDFRDNMGAAIAGLSFYRGNGKAGALL